jgi:phosphoesterase RecJ-like protein
MHNVAMWSQVVRTINENQRFIISSHVNPDMDALGSELALDEYLRSLGKQVVVLNSDAVPHMYRFADPNRRLRTFSPARHQHEIEQAQVIISLDASGGWERLGRVGAVLSARANAAQDPATVICIDHHPNSAEFADLAVVDTDAAATAELVYELMTRLDGALTPSMAMSLYLAILTDTGSFRFPKTSTRTHHIAARLMEAGADPMQLYKQVYEQSPLELVRLKGHVLTSMQLGAGGQLAWYVLDRATLKTYGVSSADLDGFPSLGMQVRGVRVSLFCVEMTRGRVKISLRSDGSVVINELASQWGGGGHPSAAGATVEGAVQEVASSLVSSLEAMLSQPA